MTSKESILDALKTALEAQRIKVDVIGGLLNLARGSGLTMSKANIDPDTLIERLANVDDPQTSQRLLAGYVSGVSLTLMEPPNSKANAMSYEQIAGRMMPNIEVDTYILGVKAACGHEPWHVLFSEGLIQVVYLNLDRGMRPLTQDQVERWGATDDRIFSAARSMLFHKTRHALIEPVDAEHPHVKRVTMGDGYDAARGMVLTDVFFYELNEQSFRFAMPSQNVILFTELANDEPERIEDLKNATKDLFNQTDYPLSTEVYTLNETRPMTASPIH